MGVQEIGGCGFDWLFTWWSEDARRRTETQNPRVGRTWKMGSWHQGIPVVESRGKTK